MSAANIYSIYNTKSIRNLENCSLLTDFVLQKSPGAVDPLTRNRSQIPLERVSYNFSNIPQSQNSRSKAAEKQQLQIEGKYEVFHNYGQQSKKPSSQNAQNRLNSQSESLIRPKVFIARTSTVSKLQIANDRCTVISLSGKCTIERQLLNKLNDEQQQQQQQQQQPTQQQKRPQEIMPSRTKWYMKNMSGECRLSRYLRRRRHFVHRIEPIREETAEEVYTTMTQSDETMSPNRKNDTLPSSKIEKCVCLNVCCGCWQPKSDDIEIFHSRTRVVRITPSPSKVTQNHCHQIRNSNKPKEVLISDGKQQQYPQVETVSSSIALKPSYGKLVTLHNYGEIVTCKNNGFSRPQHNTDFGLCPTAKHLNVAVNKKDNENFLTKKNLAIRFHWLMRPFRGRYRKASHSGHRHAVVQKMFFVNWNKPPVTLWHGYGVKRCQDNNLLPALLRRTRSAIF